MEKISGILPSSTRITSVDLKSSGSVRSGAPSYGRPVGMTSAAEREIQAQAQSRAQVAHDRLMNQRSLDPKAQIVQKMADNFFNTKNKVTDDITVNKFMDADPNADLNPATSEAPTTKVDWSMPNIEMIESTEEVDQDGKPVVLAKMDASQVEEDADLDRPEIGGYLDVQA